MNDDYFSDVYDAVLDALKGMLGDLQSIPKIDRWTKVCIMLAALDVHKRKMEDPLRSIVPDSMVDQTLEASEQLYMDVFGKESDAGIGINMPGAEA